MRGLGVVTQAAVDLTRGEQTSRLRALSAAIIVAAASGTLTYRVLRSGGSEGDGEKSD